MLRRLATRLAYAYVLVVRATSRFRFVRQDVRDRLRRDGRRFIYAFWHQRQAYFTLTHWHDPLAILISRSADGQMIADLIGMIGVGSVRGSSSRGGAAAVLEMMEVLRSGRDLGITPDGPKGPAREVKDGAIFLARKLGVPILPITSSSSSRLVLRRAWDRFHVPLPFGRGAVVYGEPIEVRPDDDADAKAAELKAALDRITDEADGLCA